MSKYQYRTSLNQREYVLITCIHACVYVYFSILQGYFFRPEEAMLQTGETLSSESKLVVFEKITL